MYPRKHEDEKKTISTRDNICLRRKSVHYPLKESERSHPGRSAASGFNSPMRTSTASPCLSRSATSRPQLVPGGTMSSGRRTGPECNRKIPLHTWSCSLNDQIRTARGPQKSAWSCAWIRLPPLRGLLFPEFENNMLPHFSDSRLPSAGLDTGSMGPHA